MVRLLIRGDPREHARNEVIENEGQYVYEREVAEPLGDGTKIATRRRHRQRKADTSERWALAGGLWLWKRMHSPAASASDAIARRAVVECKNATAILVKSDSCAEYCVRIGGLRK